MNIIRALFVCIISTVLRRRIWTVFENEFLIEINSEKVWKSEHIFYMGDLTLTETKSDSRFKEVKGKRREMKILGVARMVYPVKYPVLLTNGRLLRDIKKH